MLYHPILTICITGEIASGKGEIAKIFVEYFTKFSSTKLLAFSTPLKTELIHREIPITRKSLQDIGNEFRKFDPYKLAIRLHKLIDPNIKIAILDGARNPSEIIYFKKNLKAYIIAVKANKKLRIKRYMARSQYGDHQKIFYEDELRDKGKQEPDHGQQVAKCLEMADFIIWNNFNTLSELRNYCFGFLEANFDFSDLVTK